MPADLKLVYFDLRGRGEMIRLLLAAAGKQYEETRIPLSEWAKHKSSTPFGSLPYIVYKGKASGQSAAIAAYLSREFGFHGKTNEETCRIEEVMGLWEDQLSGGLVRYHVTDNDEEKATLLKKNLEENLPKYFGFYQRFLEENGSTGYVVGKSLTLADLYLYDMTDNVLALKKDALDKYPLMKKLRQKVGDDPKIKAYLSKRKPTAF